MIELLNHIARRMAAPVKANFVFALISFALLAEQPLVWLGMSSNDWARQAALFLEGLAIEAGVVYAACCIIYWSRSRVVRALFYAINFTLWTVTLFLRHNFQMCISQQTLTAVVETTPGESQEFLATYLTTQASEVVYIYCALALVAIIVLNVLNGRIRRLVSRWGATRPLEWATAIVAFVGLCFALPTYGTLLLANNSTKQYRWRSHFNHQALDIFTQSMHAANSIRAFGNDVEMAKEQARQVWRTRSHVTASDSLTVIYVLGESYTKWHASLYGYQLSTTPCMDREQREGRLVAFTNAVAQENITSVVEKNTFSLNSVGQGESWFEKPNFTTIFKRAGYKVYMWDIQRDFDPKKLFTMTVNQYVYDPEIVRLSYTACNTGRFSYDMQLVDDFARRISLDSARCNLVVFHLLGQHVNAAKRMPPGSEWARHFTPDSIGRSEKWMTKTKKQTIADYDNATRYNDAVLGRIFNLVRHRNAVVVYLSDHGDEVYDWTNRKGRHHEEPINPNTLRYEFEVPLVVWFSDGYAALHPATVQQLRQAAHRPVMTDLVGQMLLHLGCVSTPYYVPDRDYISPSFTPKRRWLSDDTDYDQVMRQAGTQLKPAPPVFTK